MEQLIALASAPGMWAVAAVAAAAGFARGLAGFGVGLIMMPVCAVVLGPKVAIPLMALIDIPIALWLAKGVWHEFDKREVGILVAGSAAGIPAGIALLLIVDAETIKTAVNVLVLAFAALLLMGFTISGRPSTFRSSATGFSAGLLEGAVGLPGPPIILGWLAAQVPGARLRANVIMYFFGLMVLVVPAFFIAGLMTARVVQVALLTGPVFIAAVWLGKTCVGHVPEPLFKKIVLGLVIAGAVAALVA